MIEKKKLETDEEIRYINKDIDKDKISDKIKLMILIRTWLINSFFKRVSVWCELIRY